MALWKRGTTCAMVECRWGHNKNEWINTVIFHIIRILSFCSDRPADTTNDECRHTDYTECDFSQRRYYINVSSDCWLEPSNHATIIARWNQMQCMELMLGDKDWLEYAYVGCSQIAEEATPSYEWTAEITSRFHRWLSLPHQVTFRKALLVFRSVKGLAPDYMCDLFESVQTVSSRNTRANARGDLYIPRAQTQLNQNSITISGANIWNEVSTAVRSCNSVKDFKGAYMRNICHWHFNPCRNHERLNLAVFR